MISTALLWLLVPFCLIGAVMAFLITYGEMRHHYSGRKEPVLSAARSAVVAFIVLLALSWLTAALLLKNVQSR
jgi:hypothetical protein